MLNNVAHKDLRVITRHAAEFGDNVGSVLTFPTEYGDVQREYPIFFRKDAHTGEFQSVALLGFQPGREPVPRGRAAGTPATSGHRRARTVPDRLPEPGVGGELRREPVIHVDLDNPRISRTEGEPVFLPQGGNSRYLERIAAILQGHSQGLAVSKAMFAAFSALELIEPVNVEIKFNAEEQYNLRGLYTISEEKLRAARWRGAVQAESRRLPAGRVPRDRLAEQREEAHRHETPAAAALRPGWPRSIMTGITQRTRVLEGYSAEALPLTELLAGGEPVVLKGLVRGVAAGAGRPALAITRR